MKDGIHDTFQANFCAEQLKALGDPLRLRIVELLRNGAMTVGDVAQSLDTELVTVSHHLRNLKHAQIVTSRRDGRFVYHSLRKNLLRGGKSRNYLTSAAAKSKCPQKGESAVISDDCQFVPLWLKDEYTEFCLCGVCEAVQFEFLSQLVLDTKSDDAYTSTHAALGFRSLERYGTIAPQLLVTPK